MEEVRVEEILISHGYDFDCGVWVKAYGYGMAMIKIESGGEYEISYCRWVLDAVKDRRKKMKRDHPGRYKILRTFEGRVKRERELHEVLAEADFLHLHRRTGRTIRAVNEMVEKLFVYGYVEVSDHSGTKRGLEHAANVLENRLRVEHGGLGVVRDGLSFYIPGCDYWREWFAHRAYERIEKRG